MARSAPPTFRTGARWYNGAADPISAVGMDGDYFLQTTLGSVWEKAGGAWSDTGLVIKVHDEATLARLNAAQTFLAPQKADELALTHNTAWDGTASELLLVVTNGSNFTIANPSALIEGQFYTVRVTHTTAHALAWGSLFKGDVVNKVPLPAVGVVYYVGFQAVGGNLLLTNTPINGAA